MPIECLTACLLQAPRKERPRRCLAWPIGRVEQVIAVAARQRAAFYDLAASIQRAADMLADSCPREATPTPIGRIEDLRKKLDAVRESFTAIEPALDRFTCWTPGKERASATPYELLLWRRWRRRSHENSAERGLRLIEE